VRPTITTYFTSYIYEDIAVRWDPKREDATFFHQSAALYSIYYQLQIVVHRPFIPQSGKQSPIALSSLAICTNAARACSRVVDAHQLRRNGRVSIQTVRICPLLSTSSLTLDQMAAFSSGMVLLLNIWGSKCNGIVLDPAKEMTDVHRCMNVLKQCESRFPIAGRFWYVLLSS
jgi:hypothetical protein